MFYVIRKNRDDTEEVISKHIYKDIAEEKCRKVKEKHKALLSVHGFNSDVVEFYIREK